MSVRNMQGCADKRCRVWRVHVNRYVGGKRRPITKTVHGSKRDAEAVEAEIKASLPSVSSTDPVINGRLSEVGATWAERRVASGKVTDVTGAKNLRHIRRIMREIGDPDVTSISTAMLSAAYMSMDAAPESVHNINATLRTMFADCRIAPNPCDGVELPKKVKMEKAIVGASGLRAVSSVCDPSSPCSYAVALCAQTGMRRGEVCALTYADVDFDAMTIQVRASIDRHGTRKKPKTEASARTIPLTEGAARTVLAAIEAASSRGEHPCSTSPVIPAQNGSWIDPHAVTRWWDRNRARLGFPDVTLHGLRHSYLSELARRGVPPKALQALAGHADISTTLNIYAHANLDDKRAAVESVDW